MNEGIQFKREKKTQKTRGKEMVFQVYMLFIYREKKKTYTYRERKRDMGFCYM